MRKTGIGAIRRLGLGAGLALALVAGVAPVPALGVSPACSCVTTDDSARDQADVIFKGTLDGSTSSASTDSDGEVQESGLVHQFTPTTVYKGDVTIPQYVVEPADNDPACAVEWEGPGPYLVFAERPSLKERKAYQLNDNDLLLRPCSGTEAIDADDEPDFGPGRPATPAEPAPAAPEPAEGESETADGENGENGDDGGLSVKNLLGDLLGEVLSGLLESLVDLPLGDGPES